MKKYAPLSLALAGLLAVSGIGTAVAIGDNPAPTPGQTLADYMGDDNDAQWDKLQTWVESEYGDGATVPTTPPTEEPSTPPTTEPTTPAPSPEPTQDTSPKISAGEVKWTEAGLTFDGKVSNVPVGTRIQLRADTAPLEGQRGKYEYELTTTADGAVKIVMSDYQGVPHDKLYWTLHKGGTEFTDGTPKIAEGEATKPAATPEPEPTTPPATGEGTTGGTGGVKGNVLEQPFTNAAGMTSKYRLYADGLDWSKPVGLMMYTDGTGGFGYDNPNSPYLLAGSTGLVAQAKKHNMVLVFPVAPAGNCDGGDNCWFDNSGEQSVAQAKTKAKWSSDLMTKIKGEYDIDLSRIVIGGYSSGAQWTTRYFLPAHGEAQSVDLAVPIAYGGTPAGRTTSPLYPNFGQAFKDDVVISWDTGMNDDAYSTAEYASIGGFNWYTNAGFTTDKMWVAGKGHDRYNYSTMVGEFGPIMDREIVQHLK